MSTVLKFRSRSFIRDRGDVVDDSGRVRFVVQSPLMSIGWVAAIDDENGRRVAEVRQSFFSLNYEVIRDDGCEARVVRPFLPWKGLRVLLASGVELVVSDGGPSSRSRRLDLCRAGVTVATVELHETLGEDLELWRMVVRPDEDAVLMVALAVVLRKNEERSD